MENNRQTAGGGVSAIGRPALVLTAICAVVTLLLALTNLLTADRIARNAARKEADSRSLVLAAARYEPADPDGRVYRAYDSAGQLAGVVITTQAAGYGGAIQVMTGVRTDGSVSGVHILSMSETPGLGAKAKDDKFLRQFQGLAGGGFAVSKDGGGIDAVSGATITSRAVTQAVNEAVTMAGQYLPLPAQQESKPIAGGKD